MKKNHPVSSLALVLILLAGAISLTSLIATRGSDEGLKSCDTARLGVSTMDIRLEQPASQIRTDSAYNLHKLSDNKTIIWDFDVGEETRASAVLSKAQMVVLEAWGTELLLDGVPVLRAGDSVKTARTLLGRRAILAQSDSELLYDLGSGKQLKMMLEKNGNLGVFELKTAGFK